MTVPTARVEPTPLRHRPGLQRLVAAALVFGATAALWFGVRSLPGHYRLDAVREHNTIAGYRGYVEVDGEPDDVRDDVAALHDRTRRRLAAAGGRAWGLDAFLAPLRDRIDNRIPLDGSGWTIDVASFEALAETLPDTELVHVAGSLGFMFQCGKGFTAAFAATTGDDTVTFDDGGLDGVANGPPPLPRVEVHATVSASGEAYVTPLSRAVLPGVRLVGDVVLVGERGELGRVPIDVTPDGMQLGAGETELGENMVATACTSAGLALAKAMVGWAPSLDAALGSGDPAR